MYRHEVCFHCIQGRRAVNKGIIWDGDTHAGEEGYVRVTGEGHASWDSHEKWHLNEDLDNEAAKRSCGKEGRANAEAGVGKSLGGPGTERQLGMGWGLEDAEENETAAHTELHAATVRSSASRKDVIWFIFLSAVWRMDLRGKNEGRESWKKWRLRRGSNSTMLKRGQILGIEGKVTDRLPDGLAVECEGKTGTSGVWILNHYGEDGNIQQLVGS